MGPSLVQLSAIWFLPESPRWLISHDRDDDALAALKQYHGEGQETELVRLEYEEIRSAIDNEKSKWYKQHNNSPALDGTTMLTHANRLQRHYLDVYGKH